ncbi:adenylate/guanylate cyclase domain-containing protein [Magnetovirga frankeli]|uniref:CHASE2 domain-containing protein n=1 Tax=Magnetovirga frankeli TaxID=947516 RepID=UPI001AFA4F20|nr:adenylate/guanylate cyclase domain-containing protein [gamma proteobacterium SS-5]
MNSVGLDPLAYSLRIGPGLSRLVLLLALALSMGLLWLLAGAGLRQLEERLGAQVWSLLPEQELEQRINIIAIDEKSLAEIGPWPWPRQTLARLADKLSQAGVSQQIYDIVFPERRPGDGQLVRSLRQGNALIAQIPLLNSAEPLRAGSMTHPLSGTRCHPALPISANYLASHQSLGELPKGHIAAPVDADGRVSRQPPLVCVEGQVYPSLALAAVLQAAGIERTGIRLEAEPGLLAPSWTLSLEAYPGLKIPLDAEANLRVPYQQAPAAFQYIPAADVLHDRIDPALLRGSWALVGVTAFGLGDLVVTPHGSRTPGVELQARLMAGLLDARLPYSPRLAPLYQLLLGLCYAGLLWGLAARRGRLAAWGLPLAALLLPLTALLLHWQALLSAQLWLGWLAPAGFGLLAATALGLLEHGYTRTERQRLFTNLSSYLPAEVARDIAYNQPSGSLEAERRQMTLLCADLRNFAAYGESRPPEESAALLHGFFIRAAEIIEAQGGGIQEYRGDALLACWPGAEAEAAEAALDAARQLQDMVQGLFVGAPPPGLEPLALGVGIEQGPVLVGSLGPAHRRAHSMLGDTLTIVLRIEKLTADLAQPILLGESAAASLQYQGLQSQGSYLLDGLRTPHQLYAPAQQEATGQHLRLVS